MKRTAALVTAAQVGTVQPVTARAAVKKAKVSLSWETRIFTSSSARFNDPEESAQMRIVGPIIDPVNGISCGQTVRTAMFSISDREPGPAFADPLVTARQRDGIVKVLTDRRSDNNLIVRSAGERA